MPGMGHPDGMMTWWMSGWFWALLAVAAVLTLLGWALARASHRERTPPDRDRVDALRTLEERFTRGEIDREEFESRRATLRETTTEPQSTVLP